jgi:hypothetical protein
VPERKRPSAGAVDPAAVAASFERLSGILGDMMVPLEDLTSRRCPYRDRLDRCTAKFGCRNQLRVADSDDLRMCGGDDKLDYRSAWETD